MFLESIVFDYCTVIRFVSTSAKFGISTVAGLNGTHVEEKLRAF
jgi:hypothetical protein